MQFLRDGGARHPARGQRTGPAKRESGDIRYGKRPVSLTRGLVDVVVVGLPAEFVDAVAQVPGQPGMP